MKLNTFIPLMIIILISIGFVSYYVTDHFTVKDEFTIEFDFNLVDKGMGFNLDPDKMHFGTFTALGASSMRTIRLYNNDTFKEKVQFFVSVENHTGVSHWLDIDPPTGTLLDINETKEFTLIMDPPANAQTGHYQGVIYIKITKAWPWDKNLIIYGPLEGCYSENTYEMFACGKRMWSSPYRE
ncbi:hypothetical protein HN385_00950 [archaeon]|jgi:hypothetical protein|nr:hypothetical protein [archaeon]MBT3450624.1 hypothetical protein [archaeon]MBT6868690.1 hypothetical protein [archaeon]MBT7193478.1 hypothetical protein [archaeon]MBT7381069.1 hypothetical protein [archaeon]